MVRRPLRVPYLHNEPVIFKLTLQDMFVIKFDAARYWVLTMTAETADGSFWPPLSPPDAGR